MRRNISNVLCVIGAPLFESTLAPRRSIAFRNSTGTWSRAPGKQFGILDRWRDRHTRPARWSDTLRIRPVRWRKWNRIRIDLARLADPIVNPSCISYNFLDNIVIEHIFYCNINTKVKCYKFLFFRPPTFIIGMHTNDDEVTACAMLADKVVVLLSLLLSHGLNWTCGMNCFTHPLITSLTRCIFIM